MKKTYQIVTRAARESAVVIEQFCRANGQILLPIVNPIQNASHVVESVIDEIGHQMLEATPCGARRPWDARPTEGRTVWIAELRAP